MRNMCQTCGDLCQSESYFRKQNCDEYAKLIKNLLIFAEFIDHPAVYQGEYRPTF